MPPASTYHASAVAALAAAALGLSSNIGAAPSVSPAVVAHHEAGGNLPPIYSLTPAGRHNGAKPSMRMAHRPPGQRPEGPGTSPRSPGGGTEVGSGTGAPVKPGSPGGPSPTAPTPRTAPQKPLLTASVSAGLNGWSTAGVGEVLPQVVSVPTPVGESALRVLLTGEQNRSELIFGGNGSGSTGEVVEFEEGDEYWFGYSFAIQQMTYGHPGAHNLIMQFKTEGEGGPQFGLQLWDWEGNRGLWSHGEAMGGDRFLSPISENAWHVVSIHFRASSVGTGAYQVYLDGTLVDERADVSMIAPGSRSAYIKVGLYRNGGTNPGTSELLIDSTKLGLTPESVQP